MLSNNGSKLVKALGFIAIVGILVAVGRLILKGIRSAGAEPEDEHNGV